jgi:Flp pilus assembly pilin Flp
MTQTLDRKVNMTRFISKFRADECGAVTVDWVVLTAGIVGLSIAILASVGGSTADSGDDIALCQKRMGNIMALDHRTYQQNMRAVQRRCAKI